METLSLYLLKSSGLIALFYLAYYFLLRKETFFTANRFFLLSGLATAVVLPLFYITKIVWVSPSPFTFPISELPLQQATPEETIEIDWYLTAIIIYWLVSGLFFIKFGMDYWSLNRVLYKTKAQQQADFKLIDVTEKIAPFSYFNTIVFNSSLYSPSELQSILAHEKVHSEQHHTIDVLIIRFFSIVFWFNPFIWLYQSALLQNLEFIADSEATKRLNDKKAYQMALLKITTHENCVALTNHFYQSLIKKRIVMLNKNQSKKWNSWKYALILPVLVAFVFMFQIKVLAQVKNQIKSEKPMDVIYTIESNSTDKEIAEDLKSLKKDFNINCVVSGIKRNTNHEITAINIKFTQETGERSAITLNENTPIQEIRFNCYFNDIGQGRVRIYSGEVDDKKNATKAANRISKVEEDSDYVYALDNELFELIPPTPPTPPNHPYENLMEAPISPDYPEIPEVPSDVFNKKAMKNYEKKMSVYEGKMKKIEPKIKDLEHKWALYEIEMKKLEPSVKDYEKKMIVFEKEMKIFEKEMKEYQDKYDKIFQKK
jgi:hypothetical protein